MQRDKEFEHKRILYYQAVIDLNSLKVNQDYDKLPPDEAMVRLKVPSEKREEYRKLIEPQKV